MKFPIPFWLSIVCGLVFSADAQLQFFPAKEDHGVWGGGVRNIRTVWRNAGSNVVDAAISLRLSQTSAATVAEISQTHWRQLRILPQQTIVESAQVKFPAVKSKTQFLIQWIGNPDRVLGSSLIWVYPTNLLAELKVLVKSGGCNLGLLDPERLIQGTFERSAIEFENLETTRLDAFEGKLAIIGSCGVRDPEWTGLENRIGKLARKGVAIVWILPAREENDDVSPSFYTVVQNHTAVVVANQELIADFKDDPKAQLNLLHFCKLALNPQPATLPDLAFKP